MQERGRKKIAILSDYPCWNYFEDIPRGGHPAPWLTALHRSFAKDEAAYEVHWITLSKAVKKHRTMEAGGQYMHVLPTGSKTLSQYLHYLPDRIRIAKCLRKIKPDLLHAWGTESCYGLSAKDFKGKKLFSLQGALTAYAQRSYMPPFMIRQAKFEKGLLQSMPIITTESEWARDRVLELAPGADVRLWEYAAEERFFNVERKLSANPACLMIASASHIKNAPTAIAAFSQPELRHVKLYMAGINPGVYDNLPDNVIPLGKVDREKLVEVLQKSWALIHPSLADTGPTVVKEARVMGLPCIVSTECGSKQYVVPGKSGYVISPMSVDSLVEGVLSIIKDADTSLSMGEYDKARCCEELSRAVMFEKIMALYKEILEG